MNEQPEFRLALRAPEQIPVTLIEPKVHPAVRGWEIPEPEVVA